MLFFIFNGLYEIRDKMRQFKHKLFGAAVRLYNVLEI